MASRFTTLESEAATYTQSIVKLDAKREQLQQELDIARKQMQSQLKQDSETIGELQRERNELREELEHVYTQIAPLQEQIESHRSFSTELEMSKARVVELERSVAQREQETKRLHAQANELERLRQRYQDARERHEKLQLQLDEMVSRQIARESERANDHARIRELEAQLSASLETIEDLRKERALVLATLADQRQSQEAQATVISFTQSMDTPPPAEAEGYDQEYGGRMRRDANRGLVFTEAPESCDDLKRISGIAEVLEKRLNDFGIYTFKQVMEWRPEEIEEFSRLLAFRDRIERDDWQGQARFFYNQKRNAVRSVA
jgi:predicted flap endonuclease-1-like 5' DNA nuclease